MKRVSLIVCLAMVGSLSGCVAPPPGGRGYNAYQYSGYGPRYDDYYGYGPGSRWGYAERRVRPQFTRQMPPGRGGGRGDMGRPQGPGRFNGSSNRPGGGPGNRPGPGGNGPR
ncbi:hypothetical protein [Acetobacter orientalis]|nr:hypothetical protein [Acetobacter orientalis]MCP1221995.1 hypothetical protein [Acetobacter orientalis]